MEPAKTDLYASTWDDLPREFMMTQVARRWLRGRVWTSPGGEADGGKDLRYRRERATPVVVSAATHEKLKGWLSDTAATWRAIETTMREKHKNGTIDGKVVTSIAYATRAAMEAKGIEKASTEWLARERAAKTCARVLAGFAKVGRPLTLDMPDGLPGGVSVHLAMGLNYRAPITEYAAGWFMSDALGLFHAGADPNAYEANVQPAFPAGIVNASYCEAAHIERMWWLRFVWVDYVAASPKRRSRAKKEEK